MSYESNLRLGRWITHGVMPMAMTLLCAATLPAQTFATIKTNLSGFGLMQGPDETFHNLHDACHRS